MIGKIQKQCDIFMNEYGHYPNGIILGVNVVEQLLVENELKWHTDEINSVMGLKLEFVDFNKVDRITPILKMEGAE